MESGGNLDSIEKYFRAANYISAAQIFLRDNFLLERDLTHDDIKPRLLGHWGSCPGINFIYVHLNNLIKNTGDEFLFVMGPGHAFPALQANLFIEGTLNKFYPLATEDEQGLGYLCRNFSWPYGFPSHSNPGTPGVILEGGELGYALATAYGAVLDNPDLTVACVIGDGEAETGPTATAWHLNKLVDPKTNGAVLPILHLNGYKISGPTIFGRMSNEELGNLFKGYGYEPLFVEGDQPHQQMVAALSRARELIVRRKNEPKLRPPMLIVKTLKGWTGIKQLNGKKIEGNHYAHQVVLTEAKTDPHQLELLQQWLSSYKFTELFDKEHGFGEDIKQALPPEHLRMGRNRHAHGGKPVYKPLKLPPPEFFAEDATVPGTIGSSSMRRAGLYLNEVFRLNQEARNFRLMSPDETYSNKLDQIFETTARAWIWPNEPWDQDMSPSGRVMEILSEHNLQGLAQGYVLTGRHAVFASYEAFIQIIASMTDQYAKFLHQAKEYEWRKEIGSLTYILTSSGWRQEHNGFSHQNPGFIDDMLQRQGDFVNIFFPPGGNATLAVLERCLSRHSQINVLVAGKTLEPRWLNPHQAKDNLEQGAMVWPFASDDDPDIVLVGVGDYLTKESLAAISIIKRETPEVRIRFANIMALSPIGIGTGDKVLSREHFTEIFTPDRPVICNFHGYPQTLKQILYDYSADKDRFSVHGYTENGSTTTPFDMHVRNETDRYHLAIEAFEKLAMEGKIERPRAEELVEKYRQLLDDHRDYIKEYGVDPKEIEDWRWRQS